MRPVDAHEISEQAAPDSPSISCNDRFFFCLHNYRNRAWRASDRLCVQRIAVVIRRFSCPCGSHISEANDLEVVQEIRFERAVHQVAENRQAQFIIHKSKTVSVAYVLNETAHGSGKSLVRIILSKINRNSLVEFRAEPIINSSHIVDKFFFSERRTCGKACRPDEIAVNLCVMTYITADNFQVSCTFVHLPVIFCEKF